MTMCLCSLQTLATWVEVDGFGVVSIKVDPTVEELYDIESLAEGTGIAAYMYSNIEGAPAGSKAYSAGYE